MLETINKHLSEHVAAIRDLSDEHVGVLVDITNAMVNTYKNDGKVVFFGNGGGSAQDAEHLAAELIGRFTMNRKSLPAMSLNINTSILTAVSNDFNYNQVFERQIEALVNSGDVVIGLSTSGDSENIIRGILKARDKGAKTIGFTGRGGGKLKGIVHILFEVPSDNTPRIQEVHITVGHIICQLVEEALFGNQ